MATTTCPPVRGRQNSIANGVGGGYQPIQPTQANNQSQQRKDSHIMDQSEYGMMDSNSDASFQGDFNSQSQNTISQKSSTPPTQHHTTQSSRDYRNYSVYSPPSASTPSTVFNFAQQQHVILQRTNNNQSQISIVQNSQNAPITQPTQNPYQNVAPPTPTHYGYPQQPTQLSQHRNCSPPATIGPVGGAAAHVTHPSPLGGASVGAQLQALLQHHPQLFPQLLRANQQQQHQKHHQQNQPTHGFEQPPTQFEHGLRTRRFHRWVTLTLQNRENLSKLNRDDQFRMICNLSLQALAEEALSR